MPDPIQTSSAPQAVTPPPSPDGYVSVTYLARRYRVTTVTIWRWAKAGTFPSPVKLAPKITRWRMRDVLEWEEAQQKGAA